MKERLIASSRKNPCPVCGRTKDGDCRISQDSNLVLCHTKFSEHTKDETVNGYIWIGEVTEPLNWGKWLIPSSEPRKNPAYRPPGQEFRFDYTNELGKILTRKVRIYYQEPDGSTLSLQALQSQGGDGGDGKISSIKWMYWKKIDTKVEVLESKGNQSKIRVPGQQQLQWVFRSELREVT